MPLLKGKSRKVIDRNIEEMVASGHPRRVAVAAALHTADESMKFGEKSVRKIQGRKKPRGYW